MEICPIEKCFGCGLCAYLCPTSSILMEINNEGFIVPKVDDSKCVNCGKCHKYCPSLNIFRKKDKGYFIPEYYLAWHRSDEVRYKSSSGAAFTAFSEPIIDKGGVIIGAVFDDDYSVKHIAVDNKDDLKLVRKSKYLQSNILSSFSIIRDALSKDITVLFTGTPCQCAAMEKVFGSNPLFFSCDVICHGVQSPKVFRDALSYMESRAKGKCTSVDFRSKTKGWANACTTEVIFDNGKIINKRANDIPIGAAFLKNLSIRQPCEQCGYRTIERASDITIGDFWAIRDEPEYLKKYKDLGFSSIIVNSEKGKDLLNSARPFLHMETRTEEQVKYQNNPLYKQFAPNLQRAVFFDDYNNKGFEYVWEKYLKPKITDMMKWRIVATARKLGLLKIYQKIRGVL